MFRQLVAALAFVLFMDSRRKARNNPLRDDVRVLRRDRLETMVTKLHLIARVRELKEDLG